MNEKGSLKNTDPHILGGQYESPEPKTGESIMVKMQFEVTMGLYRKGACLIK